MAVKETIAIIYYFKDAGLELHIKDMIRILTDDVMMAPSAVCSASRAFFGFARHLGQIRAETNLAFLIPRLPVNWG